MTNRRKSHAQAAVVNRRSKSGAPSPPLRFVPHSVVTAASQQVSNIKPRLLRSIDFHPAITILTAVAIIAAVCIIYLSQVTAVTDANYTLQALQSQHTDLQRKNDDLHLQIGQAQSETVIEQKARNDLKMVPLDSNYSYLTILPGPLAPLPAVPTAALPTPTEGP